MVEKENFDEVRQGGCSDSQLCCSGGSGSGGGNWKRLIFIAVILLAGGVATHSLLIKGGGEAKGRPCGSDSALVDCSFVADLKNAVCPSGEKVCPKGGACPLDKKPVPRAAVSCCPSAGSGGCCPEAGSD